MELICVRHGRTAWNAGRRFQGHTDIPLDAEGRAQAAALGVLLCGERFDRAVTSDLQRAEETARIVLGDRDVALRRDPAWREMAFGAWEGLTWDEIVARNPQFDAGNETAVDVYRPEGGEDFEALCARVGDAVAAVTAELPDGGTALIATHAGPLHALLRVLLGESEALAMKVRFLTASVTRFRRTAGVWQLAELNVTAELAS